MGANFNERNREGDTILHYCVENYNDVEFAKVLVEYGSKINVQNGVHQCALCLAHSLGKVEIKNFFRQNLQLKDEQICALNCNNGIDQEF